MSSLLRTDISVDQLDGTNDYLKGFIFMKKIICMFVVIAMMFTLVGCGEVSASTIGTTQDMENTQIAAGTLQYNQPTPTDIDYSLERYNLIRRAYWVNGQREKANSLVCSIVKPMGYIILITENGSIIGKFTVDGKVSSLNSFLTPDSEYYAVAGDYPDVEWLADVDGSYGENDNGIFFFTIDGRYVEWTGTYLYSDIPFEVENPVVRYKEVN